MSRGRPLEQLEVRRKYEQVFYEYPSKPELGSKCIWYHDIDKFRNGPYKTETTYPKNYNFPKIKIDKKSYQKQVVVMVLKSSNRSNAKTKIKVWRNTNIDYINSDAKIPGIDKNAIIMELAVGENFIEKYKEKYNL